MNHPQYGNAKKDYCEHCKKPEFDRWECGYVKKTRMTVHHIDHNNQNNLAENLQTLCRKCHDKVHNM